MATAAGINGFGRIGRNVFRAAHEKGADVDWVGVNDITDTKTLAHLLRYDSILGPFPGAVEASETGIVVDGKELRVFAERDPASLAAVTLLDRPYRRLVDDIPLTDVGFTVPDELFAGYGLGLDERWRALPDLHVVVADRLPRAIDAA